MENVSDFAGHASTCGAVGRPVPVFSLHSLSVLFLSAERQMLLSVQFFAASVAVKSLSTIDQWLRLSPLESVEPTVEAHTHWHLHVD